MKVLITGLAGMLGSNMAYLFKDKYEVSGIDIITTGMVDIDAYSFDMLDYDKLYECIKRVNPDVIVHTAAAVNVDKCEYEPQYAYDLNVKLTEYICQIANEIQAKVIYISTDAVFDGKNSELYCEEDSLHPINVYGKTKLMGEDIVKRNKENLILRTNIYGFNLQNKNSFGEWIYKSLLDGQKLRMFSDIDFSPILVNDLSDVVDASIQSNLVGVFHVCASGSITKYDFGCLLKKTFQIQSGMIEKTKSDLFAFKAKRSKHMGMNNEKICDVLSIKLATPQESIKKFYDLYTTGYVTKLRKWGVQ